MIIGNEKKILEKWMGVKGGFSVASIANPELRKNCAVLLENLSNVDNYGSSQIDLYETDTTNYGSNGGDGAKFQPIAMALLRRTYMDYFAHKVVGFQTMQGPVGLAFALRKVYKNAALPGAGTTGGSDAYEMAFRALNEYSGYTGSSPASALALATSAIYDFSNTGTAGKFGTGAVTSAAESWKFSTTMPKAELFLDKVAIQATTRKLGASFSMEAAQDLRAMQNLDIMSEMLNVLVQEIPAERDREIIGRMIQVSLDTTKGGEVVTIVDSSATDGRWSQEKFSNIVNVIVKKANDIATATMVGAGNFVIVSPRVATAIQAAGAQFTANTSDVNASTVISEIGKINGTITVYRDALAYSDYALVGFKGPKVTDSGIIVSDFITYLTKTATNPDDFTENVMAMSRYAVVDSLLGAGRYYRCIKINNLQNVLGA